MKQPTMPVANIEVGQRHRRDLGDVDGLARSIEHLGLLQPLVVFPDGRLIAGHRRLLAAKKLNWAEVPVRIVGDWTEALLALEAERDENTCRKDFTPSEAVAVSEDVKVVEDKAAKERQKDAIKNRDEKGRAKPTSPKNGEVDRHAGESARRTAAAVGMSAPTLAKAKVVVETVKEKPELQPIVDEMDRTGNVSGAFKKVQEAITPPPPPPPLPRYPHSDRIVRWLEQVMSVPAIIRHDHGGIGTLLAEKSKWDKKKVKEYILPMLEALSETIATFKKEIEDANE